MLTYKEIVNNGSIRLFWRGFKALTDEKWFSYPFFLKRATVILSIGIAPKFSTENGKNRPDILICKTTRNSITVICWIQNWTQISFLSTKCPEIAILKRLVKEQFAFFPIFWRLRNSNNLESTGCETT